MAASVTTLLSGIRPNVLVHALLGGLAGVFLSFVPFSPVLGRAIFLLGFAGVPGGLELILILIFFVGGGGLYTVGLSAVGGYVGIYLRDEV